jgi:hypothetical protein
MFYVVTAGSYSSYHIIGVTTDLKVAEQIVTKFDCGWDTPEIEEYDDGELMLRPAWLVKFDRNGNVKECGPCESEYDHRRIGLVDEIGGGYERYVRAYVSADTEDAAIKIAAEKRAMYLAEKNGL